MKTAGSTRVPLTTRVVREVRGVKEAARRARPPEGSPRRERARRVGRRRRERSRSEE